MKLSFRFHCCKVNHLKTSTFHGERTHKEGMEYMHLQSILWSFHHQKIKVYNKMGVLHYGLWHGRLWFVKKWGYNTSQYSPWRLWFVKLWGLHLPFIFDNCGFLNKKAKPQWKCARWQKMELIWYHGAKDACNNVRSCKMTPTPPPTFAKNCKWKEAK
jgi:hypothetical protein